MIESWHDRVSCFHQSRMDTSRGQANFAARSVDAAALTIVAAHKGERFVRAERHTGGIAGGGHIVET